MLAREWFPAGGGAYLQSLAHLIEGALGLVEEPVDDALAEVAVVVVVHLEDLFKGRLVDAFIHLGEGRRRLLGLGRLAGAAADRIGRAYRIVLGCRSHDYGELRERGEVTDRQSLTVLDGRFHDGMVSSLQIC